MTTNDSWAGRVALVTGASSGIGRAVAFDLLQLGMKVAVWARREERLQELHTGPGVDERRLLIQQVDLRDADGIPGHFEGIRDRWGGIDVLVNNAGLGHKAPLISGDTELWREILMVNVLALSVCTREAVRDMQRRGVAGHIIHISSMSAHRVPPTGAMYAASKHAVAALTEALRQELRALDSQIRISAISPGFVETEFAERRLRSAEQARETYERYPCLQPEDIARAVRFMLEQPQHIQCHDLLVRPTQQST